MIKRYPGLPPNTEPEGGDSAAAADEAEEEDDSSTKDVEVEGSAAAVPQEQDE